MRISIYLFTFLLSFGVSVMADSKSFVCVNEKTIFLRWIRKPMLGTAKQPPCQARYSAALGPYRRALQQGSGAWPLEGHA